MIRRRREAISARERWLAGPQAALARALDSQPARAALFPRANTMIDLLELDTARTYLDVGYGGGAFAELLAARAGSPARPVVMDVSKVVNPSTSSPGRSGCPSGTLRSRRSRRCTCCARSTTMPCTASPRRCRAYWRRAGPRCWSSSRRCAGGGSTVSTGSPSRGAAHRWTCAAGGGWRPLLTECGFDAIDLVELGPFALPPIPRVSVLVRSAPSRVLKRRADCGGSPCGRARAAGQHQAGSDATFVPEDHPRLKAKCSASVPATVVHSSLLHRCAASAS